MNRYTSKYERSDSLLVHRHPKQWGCPGPHLAARVDLQRGWRWGHGSPRGMVLHELELLPARTGTYNVVPSNTYIWMITIDMLFPGLVLGPGDGFFPGWHPPRRDCDPRRRRLLRYYLLHSDQFHHSHGGQYWQTHFRLGRHHPGGRLSINIHTVSIWMGCILGIMFMCTGLLGNVVWHVPHETCALHGHLHCVRRLSAGYPDLDSLPRLFLSRCGHRAEFSWSRHCCITIDDDAHICIHTCIQQMKIVNFI